MAATSREASVKLVLDGSQYLVEMRKVGDAVEKETKKAEKSAGMWGKGVEAVGDKMRGLGGHIKTVVGMAATLGGAFTLAGAIQEVKGLEAEFKNLAVSTRDGGGALVDWKVLQDEAMGSAMNWSQANAEVAKSMTDLKDEVGDLDFARGVIDTIAMQATRTGKPISVLTGIVGSLNEQFGITEDQVPDALQAVIEGGSKGGVTIEQLSAQLEKVGPAAQLAGLRGKEGLAQVLGMLNTVEGSVKKPFIAVSKFLDKFASPEFREKAVKELGIKLGKDGDPGKALEQIMQKTKGAKKELEKLFQGEELKVAMKLGETFAQEFDKATGTVAERTQRATDAFNKSLTDAGKAARDQKEIEAEATARLEDPQRKLQEAMNTLTAAVAQPEIIDALHELASMAPQLAKELAGLIKFIAKNPLMAGAGLAGGMVANTFASTIISNAADSFVKKAFASSATSAAGTSFAASAFGPAMVLVAAAAFAAAAGEALQERMEKADAERRKRAGDRLSKNLEDEFKRTGKNRKLTDQERMIMMEAGAGEDVTDLGRARAAFQRDLANRAEARQFGGELDAGRAVPLSAEAEAKLAKIGTPMTDADRARFRPEMLSEVAPGAQLERVNFGTGISLPAGSEVRPATQAAPVTAPAKGEDQGKSFAEALRSKVIRVEVVNPQAGAATRGPVVLPAPAQK